jgi:7-carboxy-7-deazaguanine synthase
MTDPVTQSDIFVPLTKERIYPVSEVFTSFQGEGVWSGTPMTFIRLAGCTVGKPYSKGMYEEGNLYGARTPGILPVYTEECTLYDGRKFPCDTDYRVKERLTVPKIMALIPDDIIHVNITGGEPLMHDLSELLDGLFEHGKEIHIETSGTKKILASDNGTDFDWVCVSPKFNCLKSSLRRADEIKVLVDKIFQPELEMMNCLNDDGSKSMVDILELAEDKTVFLQPVNEENAIDVENLKLCLEWQRKYPAFRLSIQLHKVIEHFINVHIR